MMKEFLDTIGIVPLSAGAGFFGGVVNVFFLRKMNAFDVIGAVLGGTLTANYLGAPFAELLPLPGNTHLPIGATSFLFGIGGLQLTGVLMASFRQRLAANGQVQVTPSVPPVPPNTGP
jgi:hypothetical protein